MENIQNVDISKYIKRDKKEEIDWKETAFNLLKELNNILKDKKKISVQPATIEEIIETIMNADNPINIEGEIENLSNFTLICEDGRWSDRGFKYYFNKETGQLVCYNWSNWQSESSIYQKATLEDYVSDMISQSDGSHFDRFVEGLKEILKIKK